MLMNNGNLYCFAAFVETSTSYKKTSDFILERYWRILGLNNWWISPFMYRRPILCTLYNALDFLNVRKKYIMYL
jgi:hypothetical protein